METRVESKQISSNYDANGKKLLRVKENRTTMIYILDLTVTDCVLNCSGVHYTDASHKMGIGDLMIEVLHSMEDMLMKKYKIMSRGLPKAYM